MSNTEIKNSYLVRGVCAAIQTMRFPQFSDLRAAIAIALKKEEK